jgi:predicted DNA-binding protein (MmcQ/YjbR family)
MPAQPRFPREESALREHALSYPETAAEFPWGHPVFKVKGKAFLFMSQEESFLTLSVKLPLSGTMALTLPFAAPTGYGLGKSGWVTARFNAKDKVPIDMLNEWVDESYRAVAPKKLLARMENVESKPAPAPRRKRGRNRA